MHIRIIIFCLLATLTGPLMPLSGQAVNQTDGEGRKQGHWIKKYPNGDLMYDGFFKNDKPEGEFRRYYENNTIKSVMIFSGNGTEAVASLYYPNGFKASEGKYVNQLKEGRWQFFSPSAEGMLISEEEYSKNKRNGISVNYYDNKVIEEKTTYKNDLLNGEYLKYYPDGSLFLRTSYVNGKLNGRFEAFFENGKPEFLGAYKDDLKNGQWIFYKKEGGERFRTEYDLGVAKNRDLDIYESNIMDSLELNKGKIADPEKTGQIW